MSGRLCDTLLSWVVIYVVELIYNKHGKRYLAPHHPATRAHRDLHRVVSRGTAAPPAHPLSAHTFILIITNALISYIKIVTAVFFLLLELKYHTNIFQRFSNLDKSHILLILITLCPPRNCIREELYYL